MNNSLHMFSQGTDLSGKKVVVKTGTEVISVGEKAEMQEGVNIKNLENLVESISYLIEIGVNITWVTSGAVAIGKKELIEAGKLEQKNEYSEDEKAICSSVGQITLMAILKGLFLKKGIIIGQGLLLHDDFSSQNREGNIQSSLQLGTKMGVLSILNENDFTSREELREEGGKFSDNDGLAGLVAEKTQADALVILSAGIEGLYKNFKTKEQELILLVIDKNEALQHCTVDKTKGGRGGQQTKVTILSDAASHGITSVLADGTTPDILKDVVLGKDAAKTLFLPRQKQ